MRCFSRNSRFLRLKPEFEQAVAAFEEAMVDAIVTMHMSYYSSLESIEALTATKLPIVVLDTTQTLEFTPEQDSAEIGYNHGIHGVMDMCSMLKRYGKPYAIAAGHYLESDCIDRVCGCVKAAALEKADNRRAGCNISKRFFCYQKLENGGLEINAEEFLQVCLHTMKSLADSTKQGVIRGICASSASGNLLLLDKEQKPATNIINWQDHRVQEEAREILGEMDLDAFYRQIGWP